MFFVMLNLTFLIKIAYFIWMYLSIKHYWRLTQIWTLQLFRESNIAVYLSAILFNLYNWNYLIVQINECGNQTSDKWYVRHYKLIYLWLHITNVVAFITFATVRCSVDDKDRYIDGTIRSIKALVFLTLAGVYMALAYTLYNKVKDFSIHKARMMRLRLILSIIFFSIPLLLKGIFYVIWVWFGLLEPLTWGSIKRNDLGFPLFITIYYTVTEMVPMGAQIISVEIVKHHYEQEKKGSTTSSQDSRLSYSRYTKVKLPNGKFYELKCHHFNYRKIVSLNLTFTIEPEKGEPLMHKSSSLNRNLSEVSFMTSDD